MSNDPVNSVSAASNNAKQAQLQQLKATTQAQTLEIVQIADASSAEDYTDLAQFNSPVMLRNGETLEKRMNRHDLKHSQANQSDDPETVQIDAVSEAAEEFQNRNPELQKRNLLNLRRMILDDDSPEQILEKILLSYPDPFLADEALDFLAQTADPTTKLGLNLRLARELLNSQYGREVRAGRNINQEAREFSKQGLGSPSALRDLYRDVTGNPREPLSLFEELSESFSFEKMKPIIQFMLHSLGSDLKAKGPSISPAELQRLFTETRTMQAILGVYRFFFQRMRLIESHFQRDELTLPKRLTFEVLAKAFAKLIAEKYPSPDKVLKLAVPMGLSEELLAQVIVFTQFRDAMRGVAPRLFKSDKHRQDLLMVLIETISDLDDLLEEEDDDEQERPKGWNQTDTIE